MHRKRFCALLLFSGLCMALMSAYADDVIYRWVDDKGLVHFGGQPPKGADATIVTVDVRAASPAPAVEAAAAPADTAQEPEAQQGESEAELSYAAQRRKERRERREKHAEEQARLEGQCKAMRQQLDWVQPNPRVLVTGDDGNPRRLTDEERESLLDEATTFIAENCN